MFSRRICESARFLQMPSSTQNLYFHLGLHADDDGIVEAFSVLRIVNATEDDLRILVAKRFVIILNEDLITYIVDWTENNRIRSDRKVDSIYQDLLLQIVPDAPIQKRKQRADRKPRTENLVGGIQTDRKLVEESVTDTPINGNNAVENDVETQLKNCNEMGYAGFVAQKRNNSETESMGRPRDADGRRKTSKVKLSNSLSLSSLSATQEGFSTVETVENYSVSEQRSIPTLQEVLDYAEAMRSDVNPYRFYEYYEKSGWEIKPGEPIRNWKSLFHSWHIHEGIFPKKAPQKSDSTVDYSQFVCNTDK